MIVTRNLFKTYNATTALSDFSYDFERGTTTVLIGPSGCGKSTLLRSIVGLVRPDRGSISINGVDLTPASLPLLRQNIGYVIQDGGLFPHLTAADNVSLLAEQLQWTTEDIQNRIRTLSDLVQLSPQQLESYPSQLSGGQRQRVSLMRALMLDPEVLLLDEPLGALDSIVRAELQEDLKTIFGRLNKTVVMITHDLAEAAYFSNQLILMNDGTIVQSGSLKAFFSNASNTFVQNFVRAQHQSASAFLSNLQ